MAQLRLHLPDIEALQAHVVLIAFGEPSQARAWIRETEAPFAFMLDPQRRAYQLYGLETSMIRSWQPKVWARYAQLMLHGREWKGIQGDSAQLAGDFIVAPSGRLVFVRRSHDPTDRPATETLLEVLRGIS